MADELRSLKPEEAHTHNVLMSHAFGRARVVTKPESEPEHADYLDYTFGAFRDGALLASLTIAPFTVHWTPELTVKMGGIAGVATFAHARGQGLVDRLLTDSLERMRAAGQLVSALFPFAFAFYRRYGWDWVGEAQDVTLPLRELPRRMPGGWSVEPVVTGAKELLGPVYTSVARQYRGAFTTESHRWDGHLGAHENRETLAYVCRDPDGVARGYLLWRYPDSGETGRLKMLVSGSADADAALHTLLRDFGVQNPRASGMLPGDYPVRSYVCSYDVEVKRRPVFMARVVDFAGLLAALPTAHLPDGVVEVAVSDPHAPWNHGLWRIEVRRGELAASLVLGGGAPQVSLDIQALSQALWGEPSLDVLRRAGRVDVRDEAGYRFLQALLPPACVHCWDDF